MKLYATVSSERATKGQGGNKEVALTLNVGSAKDSRTVALIKLYAVQGGGYEILYMDVDNNKKTTMLQHGYIEKGEKQKDKQCTCWEARGIQPDIKNCDVHSVTLK